LIVALPRFALLERLIDAHPRFALLERLIDAHPRFALLERLEFFVIAGLDPTIQW
jgi:hypothetical protein